jgi:hypothetical protein
MQFAQIALRQAGSSPAGVAGGISVAHSASCGFTERRTARERGRHNNAQRELATAPFMPPAFAGWILRLC